MDEWLADWTDEFLTDSKKAVRFMNEERRDSLKDSLVMRKMLPSGPISSFLRHRLFQMFACSSAS
jgi:hypothetical protein